MTQVSPSSSISLYADDIALYRSISSPADFVILQADITAIATWVEEERHLKLHADKCHLMLISRKRTCSITPPPLFVKADTPLQQVNSVKYLGVLLTSDLSWNEHITSICSKTRKLIGLLYRRFHHCSPELLIRHLFVHNLSILHKSGNLTFSKFALRVYCKDWSASYYDLLEHCQVSYLSDRHRTAKMCHLYIITYGIVDCENSPVTHRTLNYNCQRSNPIQIQTLFAYSSQYQFSFYPHSFSLWNNLSLSNDSLSSLSSFKHSII